MTDTYNLDLNNIPSRAQDYPQEMQKYYCKSMEIKRTTGSVADISNQESYLSKADTEVAGLAICGDEKLWPPTTKRESTYFFDRYLCRESSPLNHTQAVTRDKLIPSCYVTDICSQDVISSMYTVAAPSTQDEKLQISWLDISRLKSSSLRSRLA